MAKKKKPQPGATGNPSQGNEVPPQQSSTFVRRSFLAVLIAVVWSLKQMGDDAPTAPEKANVAFRSFSNIVQGCDEACYKKIRQDAVAVGSDVTYWLDHQDKDEDDTLMEYLTRSIFEYHCGDVQGCGGEWWVQIRDTGRIDKERTPLHFDKDETLMQEENRYAGPFLTCVTYLNEPSFPTIALDVKLNAYYDLVPNVTSEGTISKAFLAVPSLGGHTVFDGSMLHGALVDERFALNSKPPEKRFVLVMSFWKDHSRPKSAIKLTSAVKRRLHGEKITAFKKEPKSVVTTFEAEAVDQLKAIPSSNPRFRDFSFDFRHMSLHYKKGKPSVQAVYKFRAHLCLPTPVYIMRHRPQSYELHYGSKCQADLVNVKMLDSKRRRGNGNEDQWTKGYGSVVKISPWIRFMRRMQYSFSRLLDALCVNSIDRLSVWHTKQYIQSFIQCLAGRRS